jgi:hypothetical protein
MARTCSTFSFTTDCSELASIPPDTAMKRPFVASVLLALVVVLAGCGAPFGSSDAGTAERTLTPAVVPTDEPTPTTVPQLAPGIDGTGVTDPLALVEAHTAVLDERSYVLDRSLTVRYANGTVHRRQVTDARFAASRARYRIVSTYSGVPFDNESAAIATFANGDHVFLARTTNGSTIYELSHGFDGKPASPREVFADAFEGSERIYSLFAGVETRVVDRVTRNETTRYRIVGAAASDGGAVASQYGDPRNVTVSATIDTRGLVREYRLRYEGTLDGTTVSVVRRARYTAVGSTTVERPPWYEAAVGNVSTAAPASN